jgi:TRAP-type uncharacterized transport system substrate-binding protein
MTKQRRRSRLRGRLEVFALFGGSLLLATAGLLLAWQFVQPAPPNSIRMATGDPDGAYYRYAKRYQAILARDGVKLELIETQGSVENLTELSRVDGNVDIALIQGGVATDGQRAELSGLGSMFYEPVWLLTRAGLPPRALNTLQGSRIGIGPQESGTRLLSERLLAANGINDTNADLVTEDIDISGQRLANGDLDLMFVVGGSDSPQLRELIRDEQIELQNLDRAAAYPRHYGWLTMLHLPEGTLNLKLNIPPQDLDLIAATANLVARPDFHPALIALLLGAATEVHGKSSLLSKTTHFPTSAFSDFPLSADAQRFYKNGPPFLQRWLPFWVANWVDRIKVMLVPLLALMLPLSKLLPPVYRWRVRQRILRWYKELRRIDLELETEQPDAKRLDRLRAAITEIERDVAQVEVPLGYTDQLYELRSHIALLERKLERLTEPRDGIA